MSEQECTGVIQNSPLQSFFWGYHSACVSDIYYFYAEE